MHQLTHNLKEFGLRRIAFSLVVLSYLGFLGFINVMMILPDNWISAMGHFNFVSTGSTHNLVHELVFALIVGTGAVALASQLWKPKENFAGQLVALIAWGAMIVLAIVTNNWIPQILYIIFGGLTLLATILHPKGLGLFSWFQRKRISSALFALVIIAVIPFTMFAFANLNLQLTGSEGLGLSGLLKGHNRPVSHGGEVVSEQDSPEKMLLKDMSGMAVDMDKEKADHDQEHITIGHYRNMAVFGSIIILIGLLASFRPSGWRFAAWITGFLSIALGLASAVLPNAESSLGVAWGIAALIWGIMFIVVAEVARRKEQETY